VCGLLIGQLPGDTFDLRQIRHRYLLAHGNSRRCQQALFDTFDDTQTPGTYQWVAACIDAGICIPVFGKLGQLRERVNPIVHRSCLHHLLPAAEKYAAIIKLYRHDIGFVELLASEQAVADLAGACAERIA